MNPKFSGTTHFQTDLGDITGRSLDRDELIDFVHAHFQDAQIGVFICDFDTKLQSANSSFLAQIGHSSDEVFGTDLTELVADEYQQTFQELCAEVNRASRLSSFLEIAFVDKTGRQRWVSLEGLKINAGHEPALMLGIVHDMTEQRSLLGELRSREAGYRTLINASLNAAFLIDLTGNITVANERGARRVGHSPAEIVGRNFADLLPADIVSRRKEAGIKAVLERKVIRLEDEDANGFLYEHQFFPVTDENGEVNHLAIYSVDITERRASEEERERLQAQLQQAQKMEAIGTLAGGIAHDFNNLMMAIQGNVSLVLLDMPKTHAHFKPLKNIEKGIRRGADLTSKLLGYARKGKYEIKPVGLNLLVTEISETFGRMRKDIVISRELAADLNGIMADKGQLEQVLLNLFVNAADAMRKGGSLTIKTRNVTHECIPTDLYKANPGSYVQLSVTDTGTGMPLEIQERIFDPFFTTKKMGRGTGLGLASAYGIVKSHNGYIEVESQVGRGSTFYIYLPTSKRKSREDIEENTQSATGSGTVLLVDDEQNVLTVTSQMLTKSGFAVIEAISGREAIESYARDREKIDLIVLDMVMPEMGGGEVYDRIKALNPTAKVLLASGYSLEGQAREIMKRGCDGFIQKPFTLKELVSKVQMTMECH